MPSFNDGSHEAIITARRLNALDRVRHKLKVSLPGSGSYNHSDIQVLMDYIDQLEGKCSRRQSQLRDADNKINDLIRKLK
jgi:hypothetical protein